MLGRSWVTVSRWERGVNKPLPKSIVELERLARLIFLIEKSISKKEIFSFLTTPNRFLDKYRPIDLLKDDYSFRILLEFAKAAKSGDMA